jgi:Fe-S cluster assembly iron-binding protein IscA
MLALTSNAAVAAKSRVSAFGLHGGAGLRITANAPAGDGYEFELTPSAAPGANDRVVTGDDALVFVDPPASAALEDALLDATDPGRRGPLRLPPSKFEAGSRIELTPGGRYLR